MSSRTRTTALALSVGAFCAFAQAEPASQAFMPITLKSASEQDQATGFFEGQSLGGSTRNWYAHERAARGPLWRYYKSDGTRHDTHSRENWVQGTILNYSSGFTQGTVGFATEVAAYNAVALQRSRSAIAGPNNRTLTHSDGDPVGQWSKAGLANVKARISNTTLTVGRQSLDTPMIAYIGNRALPSSFEGVALHSAEFDNLTFDFGTFDRVSPRTEQSLSKFRSEYGAAGVETDRASTAGLSYQPFKSLTTSLYATRVDDFWNQYYFGASHVLGDSDVLSLNTGLNYYKTVDTGSKKMGEIDNDTYSLSLGLTHQAHTLTASWQQVNGNEYFDYLHETNGIYLANSLLSDFNGPNEKSLQIAYVLNMAQYGVPGLKFNLYNARGWGIDGTHYRGTAYDVRGMDGETHYEWGIGTSYAVQSGPLKDTAIRATYTAHRASQGQADGSLDEFRLVTTIPFNIL
ncbi:OprD family porin [Pseudomonas sp. S75]|uniref:OprD family porin n=1 Tax=unclassified Pseudomonas TaxID=196821 RepID=UPI001906542D|nr:MULTISPECIES: OprD family porin [unclassified Pseudomonas]MBJ9976197.1 OprD family porin [Pseudomonas sp. S30]MBK0155168.1 OprD family porin [Pseudomonas sp. S75]